MVHNYADTMFLINHSFNNSTAAKKKCCSLVTLVFVVLLLNVENQIKTNKSSKMFPEH